MKKIILSAAVAAMAFSTSAMAADKGIDIDVGGQAVVYYQTSDSSQDGSQQSMMSSDNSSANVGIQLDLAADLGNNFTFGSQLTHLSGMGLQRTAVDTYMQDSTTNDSDTRNDIALTKIFIAKKVGNTTVKLGRQELPKSLSPLAFSEGWNVYKNTFDAIVAINTDLPNTTLVGAYVTSSTGSSDLGTIGDMSAHTTLGGLDVNGAAYMITASNKSLPMTTVTASYYDVKNIAGTGGQTTQDISANAMWLDVAVSDKSLPMGLNLGLQAGKISPKSTVAATNTALDDTTAYGLKASLSPMDALTLGAAYTSVDGADNGRANVEVRNFGGTKTPLFTQMVGNQGVIAVAADTLVLSAGYNMGDMGSISVAYGMTDDKSYQAPAATADDYNEFDLVYKIKAGGVQYLAAYVNQSFDGANGIGAGDDKYDKDIVRLWARYNF